MSIRDLLSSSRPSRTLHDYGEYHPTTNQLVCVLCKKTVRNWDAHIILPDHVARVQQLLTTQERLKNSGVKRKAVVEKPVEYVKKKKQEAEDAWLAFQHEIQQVEPPPVVQESVEQESVEQEKDWEEPDWMFEKHRAKCASLRDRLQHLPPTTIPSDSSDDEEESEQDWRLQRIG
jgi:hypothetical protein